MYRSVSVLATPCGDHQPTTSCPRGCSRCARAAARQQRCIDNRRNGTAAPAEWATNLCGVGRAFLAREHLSPDPRRNDSRQTESDADHNPLLVGPISASHPPPRDLSGLVEQHEQRYDNGRPDNEPPAELAEPICIHVSVAVCQPSDGNAGDRGENSQEGEPWHRHHQRNLFVFLWHGSMLCSGPILGGERVSRCVARGLGHGGGLNDGGDQSVEGIGCWPQ